MNPYTDPYKDFPLYAENELRGTEGMSVRLIDYSANPYYVIATGQSVSWRPWKRKFQGKEIMELMEKIVGGKVWAGQIFDALSFTFLIENISRATTHQLVRARIGASFMQESGREGKWDECKFITPLTILEDNIIHKAYVECMKNEFEFYSNLKLGLIPPQDARFAVGHGIAQNMWMTMNMTALMNWCSKRLCTTMQWEINTLARMIRDSVLEKYPLLGLFLKSSCERNGGCKSITNFYGVGAEFNGNKVYFPLEGNLCGKAGIYSEDEVYFMVSNEKIKILEGKYE